MKFASRIVSQACDAAADTVYAFAHRAENLPQWASGLATSLRRQGDEWITDTPAGPVRIAMAPHNAFRVMDHDVTLPGGLTVHNAFRVTPAGDGSVLAFVVLRMPDATDEAFERDCAHVAQDLRTLKALVEGLAAR